MTWYDARRLQGGITAGALPNLCSAMAVGPSELSFVTGGHRGLHQESFPGLYVYYKCKTQPLHTCFNVNAHHCTT